MLGVKVCACARTVLPAQRGRAGVRSAGGGRAAIARPRSRCEGLHPGRGCRLAIARSEVACPERAISRGQPRRTERRASRARATRSETGYRGRPPLSGAQSPRQGGTWLTQLTGPRGAAGQSDGGGLGERVARGGRRRGGTGVSVCGSRRRATRFVARPGLPMSGRGQAKGHLPSVRPTKTPTCPGASIQNPT